MNTAVGCILVNKLSRLQGCFQPFKLNTESRTYGDFTHINKFAYTPNYVSFSLV